MFGLLAGLHALLFRGVLWLLKLPLKGLLAFVVAVLALLGEEVRRWLGVLMAGVMILGVSWALLKVAAHQQLVLLLVMLLGLLWLRAVFVAASMTMHNRLISVRQRQAFRELRRDVAGIGDRLQDGLGDARDGLARRTRTTPFGGVFRANREADRQAAADAQESAERAAVRRREAQRQAEVDQQAREERDRHLERVGAEHDPFTKQGG